MGGEGGDLFLLYFFHVARGFVAFFFPKSFLVIEKKIEHVTVK